MQRKESHILTTNVIKEIQNFHNMSTCRVHVRDGGYIYFVHRVGDGEFITSEPAQIGKARSS